MVSLCMPSRTAFLTSRRPDTTRNYVIGHEYWRTTGGPNATSLPQHFKESGYRTVGMGKIFHGASFPWTTGRGKFDSGSWDGNFSWSQVCAVKPVCCWRFHWFLRQLFLSAEQTARGRNHTIDSWACAHRSQCHISISTTGATTETALASARSTCLITTCRTVNLRTVLSSGSSVLARTSAPKLTNGLFS